MKTSCVLVLLLVAATMSNAEVLLDVHGEDVQPGLKYYMVPDIWGGGGGGMLPSTLPGASSTCPSYVGQADWDRDRGVPVIINPVNRSDATSIDEIEKVNIRFSKVDDCVKTPYWTLTSGGYVATEGSEPKYPPSAGGSDNVFSFVKASTFNSYRWSYCPCNLCLLPCGDIIRASVNGQRMLKADSIPSSSAPRFVVVFIKAEDEVSTSLLRTRASDD